MFGDTKLTGWSAQLVAEGPVFGRVEYTYRHEDGNTVKLGARLYTGAAGLYGETHVPEDRPKDGVDIVLSQGLPPLTLVIQREAYGDRPEMQEARWGTWVEIPLTAYHQELVTNLSPWADWWSTWTQTSVRLRIGGQKRELQLASHAPGEWVEPAVPGTMRDWSAWQHKLVPVKRGTDGEVFMHVNNAAGVRKWSIEDREPAYAEARRMSLAQVKAEWPPLDEVKDWVLAWPSDGKAHPHLFVSPEDMRAAWQRIKPDPDVLRLEVRLPSAREDGGEVTQQTVGQWKLAAGQVGVTLTAIKGGCRLLLARGVVQVVLEPTRSTTPGVAFFAKTEANVVAECPHGTYRPFTAQPSR